MPSKVRVLLVCAYYPFPRHKYGANNVHLNLIETNSLYSADILSLYLPIDEEFSNCETEFSARFHKIANSPKESKYTSVGAWLKSALPYCVYIYRHKFKEIAKCIRNLECEYDVIHFSTSYLLPVIDYLPSEMLSKVICSPIDTISLFTRRRMQAERNVFTRLIYSIDHRRAERFECFYYKKVKGLILASDVDRKEMSSIGVEVHQNEIPNGVDCNYFKPTKNVLQEANSLIFTGNMTYVPNKQAVLFIVNQLYPILKKRIENIRIYIVGAGADAELLSFNCSDIVVTGFVNDIREYVERAAVCISPLAHSGGGFKNKVLEAMALSKIVIGSPISFEGIEGESGEHYLQIDNLEPQVWCENIIAVFSNTNRYEPIGVNARRMVERCFSWTSIRALYGNYYREIGL